MRPIISLFAIAAAVSAIPAIAQQTASDFQLPPAPTPSPTTQTEGPVDDSGAVPVAPREVVAPAPSPASTAEPTPTPASATGNSPSSRPIVQPIPRSTPSVRASNPGRVSPQRQPQSRPTNQSENAVGDAPSTAAVTPQAQETSTAIGGETNPTTSPAPPQTPATGSQPETDASSMQALPENWALWAGGAAAILLAILLTWIWRRRREEPLSQLATAPDTAMENANSSNLANAAEQPDIKLKLEIEQLSRSMMMLTLKCRITLSNRSARAARNVCVSADLACANRSLPMDAQIAGATSFLPEMGSATRIGPHKTHSIAGTLTLPIQDLAAIRHRGRPMVIPLTRVRVDCDGCEPEYRTFVVGIAADPSLQSSSKLHPVPLDGTLGSYPNVRSRLVTNADKA